ncbi:MetQ/NlpA family ABC transporter substrate-binding protein [Niallia sp. 03091]|uniref:MetQ/NlpA family ABC transporter substrate-binding protein n=1 Tax=Niallia sp. 03091 TaxID=3458059 RepID=UPI004044C1AC
MKFKKLAIIFLIISLLSLSACSSKSSSEDKPVVIGTTEAQLDLWNFVKERAKKQNIEIDVKVLTGNVDIDQLTADGEVDANAFQHMAYLYSWNKLKNQDLVPVGSTIIAPLGIYSKKIKNLKHLKDGAEIAVPNDDSNWPRALVLLQSAGLIKLKDDFDGKGGDDKIKENPKHIKITPMQSATLPRVLDDVDAAVIINGTALQAGYPLSTSLFHEDKQATPYINVIATKKKNQDNTQLKKVAEIFHSKEVREFIDQKYKGNFIHVTRPIDEVIKDYENNFVK